MDIIFLMALFFYQIDFPSIPCGSMTSDTYCFNIMTSVKKIKQEHSLLLFNDMTKTNNVREVFTTNRGSTSFCQPTREMNVATGCPQFISLGRFKKEGYVKNDCIYVDVGVEAFG